MKNAGIRTGAEYLEGLRDDREIWTRGARVKDVTAEAGIRGGTASLAGFLDRQHEEAYRDKDLATKGMIAEVMMMAELCGP